MSEKQVWEQLGAENPYYGVYTAERMRRENLDAENLNDFFSSGVSYLEQIWEEIENHFVTDFKPQKALDFGCGVGRLALPLAGKCETVWGADISDSMLAEARKNAAKEKVENVRFVNSQQFLSEMPEKFDFINSFIVFQHIKPKSGEQIFEKLVKMLKSGGIGVLHLTYQSKWKTTSEIKNTIYKNFPLVHRLRNLVLRVENIPFIPMNSYNLNNIFSILQENGCHKCFLRFTHHGYFGVIIFFQKSEDLFE